MTTKIKNKGRNKTDDPMSVIHIRTCGRVGVESITHHGDGQRLVGGEMRREVLLDFPDLRIGILTNKFAKETELSINMPAVTWLAGRGHSHIIRGDVLVVGVDDEGRECSCPRHEEVLATIPDMWREDEATVVSIPSEFLDAVSGLLSEIEDHISNLDAQDEKDTNE